MGSSYPLAFVCYTPVFWQFISKVRIGFIRLGYVRVGWVRFIHKCNREKNSCIKVKNQSFTIFIQLQVPLKIYCHRVNYYFFRSQSVIIKLVLTKLHS